jgi:hypothetical protein
MFQDDTMNVGLDNKAKANRYREQCQRENDNELKMSKRSPKTTLGNLQGDQSKEQVGKSLSFIISPWE